MFQYTVFYWGIHEEACRFEVKASSAFEARNIAMGEVGIIHDHPNRIFEIRSEDLT